MKKKIFIISIILLAIWILSVSIFINNSESADIKSKFDVSKIHYYSNVNADVSETTYDNPEWNLNVYQYTDIAIYVDRLSDSYITKVYIDNIEIENSKKGVQDLYYLNPTDFGACNKINAEKIDEKLEYNIIDDRNIDNDVKYNIPIFFEDCSNPITIRYINSEILKNYKIENTERVSFDGSLLKNGKIDLEDIESKISMNLNIVTKRWRN